MPFGFHQQDGRGSNMASSSKHVGASSAINISLSSNNSSDRRAIELKPGSVCTIGRASKSDIKNMRSTPTNALFDCPVVSRTHAELRASPWQPPGRQVSIVDKSSLHGTTVNDTKLQPNVAFCLKNGDVIKLGETVSRGKDTHDGVSLTFKRLDDMSESYSPPSPVTTRGFHLPPDSDQSDIESDNESFVSNALVLSSAKTTPEQSKIMPGSQEQPIDMESKSTRPAVIDLASDDEEITFTRAAPPTFPRSRVIQDSVDPAPILVPDSVAEGQAPRPQSPVYETDSEPEEAPLYNTGLSQILNGGHANLSQILNEGHVSDDDELYRDSDVDEDDFEYDLHDDIAYAPFVEADYDVNSDAGGRLEAKDSDESEAGDDEWPSNREQSSELGNLDLSQASLPPFKPVSPAASFGNTTKPRYDPVRSSQPLAEVDATSGPAAPTPAEKPASGYTYGYPTLPNNTGFMSPTTDFRASSRWDIHPANVSPYMTSTPQFSSFGYAINHVGNEAGADFTMPAVESPPAAPAPFFVAPEPALSPAPVAPAPTASAAKMAIDNLLEAQAITGGANTVASVPAAQQTLQPPVVLSTGSKRKAEHIEIEEEVANKSVKVDAVACTRLVSTSARRHRKKQQRSAIRTLAVEAAKMVGYASVGAAGLAAFLVSPYAQQAIDYLG